MNKNMLLSNRITTRKCSQCKEMIIIENYLFEPQVEIIHFENKSYHKSCFKEMLESKKKYRDLDFDVFWAENIDKSNSEYWSIVTRNHLYKYLGDFFEITIFTSAFYQKMEQIFNGKWKNVTKPVLPEHLLDMFQRKKSKIESFVFRIKKLSGMSALNYSLVLIINQYEDYLNWIAKMETEKKQIVENSQKAQIQFGQFINNNSMRKKEIKSIFEETE